MAKKYTQLPVAGALTGAEILAVVQDGQSRQTTISAIAAAFGVAVATVDTTGATITLDFNGLPDVLFNGSASFSGPKTIAYANNSNALFQTFVFEITDVAAVLTFPLAVLMSDIRYNDPSSKKWTADDVGIFKLTAVFNGTYWITDILGPYA